MNLCRFFLLFLIYLYNAQKEDTPFLFKTSSNQPSGIHVGEWVYKPFKEGQNIKDYKRASGTKVSDYLNRRWFRELFYEFEEREKILFQHILGK